MPLNPSENFKDLEDGLHQAKLFYAYHYINIPYWTKSIVTKMQLDVLNLNLSVAPT
jgi:hypothetical protein